MQKVQEELEALEQRVAQGKLKAPEKIEAAASRVLSRHRGFRYYAWELHLMCCPVPTHLRRQRL